MTKWHLKSRRKITGGLLKRHSKKKKYQMGRDYIPTILDEPKKRKIRKRGGKYKFSLLSTNVANVFIDGKVKKAKILTVLENKADPQFIRRNIITKGAIIDTEVGKAKVTSRPTQDGVVNAVLLKENKV
ncbi:MAG: 30S ribosomal protein S8e [Candidatus Aenigmatarchaeota archaeon]